MYKNVEHAVPFSSVGRAGVPYTEVYLHCSGPGFADHTLFVGHINEQGMSVPCSGLHYALSDQHTLQLNSQQYQQKHDILNSEKAFGVALKSWRTFFQVTY